MTFIIDLWTDGSGTTAGNPGGWAYVMNTVHPKTGEIFERCESGFTLDATNNRMEMTALLMGLRAVKAPAIVVVHTDSQYLMKPWTLNWFRDWIRKDWHKVKNDDLWKELLAAAEPHILTWEWVKGHTKVELNEECDALAGIARRTAIAIQQEEAS